MSPDSPLLLLSRAATSSLSPPGPPSLRVSLSSLPAPVSPAATVSSLNLPPPVLPRDLHDPTHRRAGPPAASLLIRVSGIPNLLVWFEAGATKFDFSNTKALFFVQLLLMGFAETKRYMDIINPGSQAEEGTLQGIEAALEGLQPGYPGGPLFNPLLLAKDIENTHEVKLEEIKNGRLAMIAMLGFIVQASETHVGPIDNLLTHLSDPFNKNIIHTLASP